MEATAAVTGLVSEVESTVHFRGTNFHAMGKRSLSVIHSMLSLFLLCLLIHTMGGPDCLVKTLDVDNNRATSSATVRTGESLSVKHCTNAGPDGILRILGKAKDCCLRITSFLLVFSVHKAIQVYCLSHLSNTETIQSA